MTRRRVPREDLLRLAGEALARGYYDTPKRVGVRELSALLGLSKSTIARRLKLLERDALEKLIASAPSDKAQLSVES